MALLIGVCHNLKAQTALGSIEGIVLTDNHSPAEAATIILLKAKDSSIINSSIIDKTGNYRFNKVATGNYLLLVTAVGYNRTYSGPYFLTEGHTLRANDIVLMLSSKQLNEVSVVSNRPDIEVKEGKIIINMNGLVNAGSSVFDILRNSPGVRIYNNNISIIGKESALITIDGKPTNLSGEDLAGMLRGMQSVMIERIELITSGSAKYDAATGGVINIVMKKGRNNGTNAIFTATAGYGRYGKGSAGVVFNNRTDKVNIFGSYNHAEDKTFHDFTTDRSIIFGGLLSDYHVNYNSLIRSHNNGFSFGSDFFLSDKHTIGFLINGQVRDDDLSKNNNLNIYNSDNLDSVIEITSAQKRHVTRINYNVNYSGKLDQAGTILTANFNYTTYNRSSSEYIDNNFYNGSGTAYRDRQLLQNLSPSNIHIWLSKLDYSHPFSKTSKLEAGLKYSYARSDNDLIFGPLINGVYTSNPTFSSHFLYTENVNAGYVDYQNQVGKIDMDLSLRAEQTFAKGTDNISNSNYLNLFPTLRLSYKFDAKHDLTLSYNRGIKRPDYEELNPFLYYVDIYDYRSGNPNLKPEHSNNVELNYTYNKIITTLYSNIITNAYEFNLYIQNDSSKVNITTNKNFGNIYNYGVRFYAPATFTTWWSADFFVDAAYQRYKAYPENGNLNKGTQDITLRATQHFTISKTLLTELTGSYETPSFYGINEFKSYYYVNAGIGKQLFNQHASLRLSAADLFNTNRDRSHTTYENLNLSTVDKKETQVFRLTFTYRFGKTGSRASTPHHTGNEDEQKRIGSHGDN